MQLIKWNDSFSVNVAEIDLQHEKLASMINELNEAMLQAKGKVALTKILNELVAYTVNHFGTEEKYFAQYDFPYANNHKKEHQAFKEKVAAFKKDFDAGKLGLSIEVMKFLSDWLQTHIKGTDKKYSSFFNEKGLK
jgi:hemerythrin